jgi:hypothetical protein
MNSAFARLVSIERLEAPANHVALTAPRAKTQLVTAPHVITLLLTMLTAQVCVAVILRLVRLSMAHFVIL